MPNLLEEDNVAFEAYANLLETVPIDCDTEIVDEVAGKLRGGVGPSSVEVPSH